MPTRRPDEQPSTPRAPIAPDQHPVEHFLEVLLIAQDRAASEHDAALRQVWQVTIRDIETVLADDTLEVVAARDRLALRSDADGRRMHACACELLRGYDDANRKAEEVIGRAQKRQDPEG